MPEAFESVEKTKLLELDKNKREQKLFDTTVLKKDRKLLEKHVLRQK